MRTANTSRKILLTLGALIVLTAAIAPSIAQADHADAVNPRPVGGVMRLEYLGAGIGAGMVVIGAAIGIGRFTAAAAEGIARQPQAAAQITGAVNLPLFLLEGVAIIAEVVCLLLALKA